jgi:hypothetical protein
MIPASVIGIEQSTVTKMASRAESIKITGDNNLGMVMG